ncbi:MAG TPA: hypothetical protein ENL45_02290, partial [Candidatus Woesearchaeota archaeon]|nr:hypothetical protein [Candidatus Woesearchaeota archaeon]
MPKIFASDNSTNLDFNENNSLILLRLEYKNNSSYDMDNDGIETLEGVIDFTVENTVFNFDVNKSNLCTRWETYSVENETSTTVCYGSEMCCNFVELEPSTLNWDEVFYSYYGRYGATANNKISAQVVYVDYSLDPENPYSDIYYSKWDSLSAIFKKETKLYTKIINFVKERLSILRGAVMKITAVLSYVNDSPIPYENVSLYVDTALVDTKTTDIFGNVTFEWDTSLIKPDDYVINVSFSGGVKHTTNETIILMPSFNKTVVKVIPSDNQSFYITENLTQLNAEIGNPVKWIKKINLKNLDNESKDINFSFELPEEADNIIVERDGETINEKKKGIMGTLLSLGRPSDEPSFELDETKNRKKRFKLSDEINKIKTEYNIEYETEAPKKDENLIENGNAIKRIRVYSEVPFHYHNVRAFTEIDENIANLRLYHFIGNSRIDITENPDYDVRFIDTNKNGLNDRIEWTVPMLSEQVFEIGVATVNTRKSIYHPYEEANIVMVILDINGHLVSDADVNLKIIDPANQDYYFSTGTGSIKETNDGIYEAEFIETGLEGNYSMLISALSDDVNSTMNSYFTVKNYYEFDILRNTPVTTDPWIGPFDSSVNIVSYTNITYFDFIEILPYEFNITETGGSTVTELNDKKILTWNNLE